MEGSGQNAVIALTAAGLGACLEPLRGGACARATLALRNLTVAELYDRHGLRAKGKPEADVFWTWEFRANERLLAALVRNCLGRDLVVDDGVDVDILRLKLPNKLRALKSSWIKACRHGENSTACVEAFLRIRREVPPDELCPSMGLCGCSGTGANCL